MAPTRQKEGDTRTRSSLETGPFGDVERCFDSEWTRGVASAL